MDPILSNGPEDWFFGSYYPMGLLIGAVRGSYYSIGQRIGAVDRTT